MEKDYDWFRVKTKSHVCGPANEYYVAIDFVDRPLIAIPCSFTYCTDKLNNRYSPITSNYFNDEKHWDWDIMHKEEPQILSDYSGQILTYILQGFGWYWDSVDHKFKFILSIDSELDIEPLDKMFGIPLNGLKLFPDDKMFLKEMNPEILSEYRSDSVEGRYIAMSGKSYALVFAYNDTSKEFYKNWLRDVLVEGIKRSSYTLSKEITKEKIISWQKVKNG